MKAIPVLVLAAGAALAAPAFADTIVTTYNWDPVARAYVPTTSVVRDSDETYWSPQGAVVYTQPGSTAYSQPVTTYTPPATTVIYGPGTVTYQDDIVVTAPRESRDQMITNDVVDTIAADPRVGGRIGVDTYRDNVTLTGSTATRGQADRAERDAKSVEGVRDVTNLVRPRVGG
jgi:BON domain-containing protein